MGEANVNWTNREHGALKVTYWIGIAEVYSGCLGKEESYVAGKMGDREDGHIGKEK